MKRLLTCLFAAAMVVPLAGADATSLRLSAPLIGLAANGTRVAVALGSRPGDCAHVLIWSRLGHRLERLGRAAPCGPVTSTGRGLVGPSIAGPRALWITYVGGNIREWSLWTASVGHAKPRLLRFVPRNVESTPPLVLGVGDASKGGFILPYALDDTVYSLQPDGRLGFSWQAPERVIALAARNGELAVALASGPVVILGAAGQVLRTETFDGPVDAVAAAGSVVQRGHVLEWLTADGWQMRTIDGAWHLADVFSTIAVYTLGHQIHAFNLSNGKDALVLRTTAHPFVQIDSSGGLVYGSGRRVSFIRGWSTGLR
ncbi:MAG: hypothetical protein WBB74_03915 [Gaiellaceae bacterium]